MNSSIKSYKILANSQNFGNMKGTSVTEVSKKAAKKILDASKSTSEQVIITETKTGKTYNYNALREDLVRPYYKNGKLVKHRIIVRKNSNKLHGGENSTQYTKFLNLLFEHDVQAFIDYVNQHSTNRLGRANDLFLLRHGLFENPSLIANRIAYIYRAIDWQNLNQNKQKFLTWLTTIFMPVLNKIKQLIPNIDAQVDKVLMSNCGKNLETIIQNLTNFCRNGAIPSN